LEPTCPDLKSLNQLIVGAWTTQAIYVAAELGLADLLVDGPRKAEALARETGTQGEALYRLLRALASIGIFAEDPLGRFSLTPLAELLRRGSEGSQRSLAIMAGTEFYESWGRLLGSVKLGEEAFERTFGMPFFRYLTENPARGEIYDTAMNVVHGGETRPMLDAYDFSAFRTVVDVGGGNGLTLATLLRRHAGTRGILYDLPAVAGRAREALSEAGLAGRCQVVGGDFFRSLPAGSDAYLLRHVLHDWDDERAVTILRNCREAMNPAGKVLVVETVLPTGNGPCFGKWLDLMMLIVGGRERTEAEYRGLFSRAGLTLERVVPTAHEVSVLEGTRPP